MLESIEGVGGQLPKEIVELCRELREASVETDRIKRWPENQLAKLRESGVFRWFIPKEYGGDAWTEAQILDGYLALSQCCLTTTFILTQWNAACKRLIGSENEAVKREWLPALADGSSFATVAISHLTTSRQHLSKPVLSAVPESNGFRLNGFSPWVTSAPAADVIVLGASLEDGTQLIAAVEAKQEGVEADPGIDLVALSSSCTDQIRFNDVFVARERIVAGPVEHVMQTNSGGGAGGLQTSTLAIGLSSAASAFLNEQASKRPDLDSVATKIQQDTTDLCAALRSLCLGSPCGVDAAELRRKANSLVLRSTQAALSAAKGAGFVASHPTGRWAREALFFLVWSCPQPVVSANLCELAQLETA